MFKNKSITLWIIYNTIHIFLKSSTFKKNAHYSIRGRVRTTNCTTNKTQRLKVLLKRKHAKLLKIKLSHMNGKARAH